MTIHVMTITGTVRCHLQAVLPFVTTTVNVIVDVIIPTLTSVQLYLYMCVTSHTAAAAGRCRLGISNLYDVIRSVNDVLTYEFGDVALLLLSDGGEAAAMFDVGQQQRDAGSGHDDAEDDEEQVVGSTELHSVIAQR